MCKVTVSMVMWCRMFRLIACLLFSFPTVQPTKEECVPFHVMCSCIHVVWNFNEFLTYTVVSQTLETNRLFFLLTSVLSFLYLSIFHLPPPPPQSSLGHMEKQEIETNWKLETEMEMQPLRCCSPGEIHVLLAFVPMQSRALPCFLPVLIYFCISNTGGGNGWE